MYTSGLVFQARQRSYEGQSESLLKSQPEGQQPSLVPEHAVIGS